MKKDKEEIMTECLQKYREIDEMISTVWKDDIGKFLHQITNAECDRIEKHMTVRQEQEDE